MHRKSALFLLCAISFSLFVVISTAGAATETFEQTYQVESGTMLELRNKNGDVSISHWDQLKTSNGSVKLHVPVDMDAKVDLKTSNGKITLHDGLEVTTSQLEKNEMQGRIGDGGPEISVKTSNGKIDIYRYDK